MDNNIFSPMEIDAIGEIMNISLGSSATAVSNMLEHRVDITTPRISLVQSKDLVLGDLDPAVGVEIRYVSGLEGSNIMLLKRGDVKTIVDILMGSETPEEEFELNELTISAVCEVMNQMMGAASTALSDFLGRMVNISTPQSFELDDFNKFKEEKFPADLGNLVVVRFVLTIEGFLQSEFINVISVELARELISGFGLEDMDAEPAPPPAAAPSDAGSGTLSQDEIEKLLSGGGAAAAPTPAPAASGASMSQEEIEKLLSGGAAEPTPPPAPSPAPGGTLSQEEIEKMLSGGGAAAPTTPPPTQAPQQIPTPYPGGYPPYPANGMPPPAYDMSMPPYYPPPGYYYPPPPMAEPASNKVIQTQSVQLSPLDPESLLSEDQTKNLDLIMSVPLEVSVEIGRTQRKVQDILAFSKGSLVVLDKLAGDQVDLFVNGHCVARGDVVVIDDNFGIRITEILTPPSPNEILSTR